MTFEHKTYCCKNNLKEIRSFINESLGDKGFDAIELNNYVLAVDEICANRIIHANNCNPEGSLIINIDFQQGKMITIKVSDNGEHFDYGKYNSPKLTEIVKSKKKGGVGLVLVNKIMDSVDFKKTKDYNICILKKKLS